MIMEFDVGNSRLKWRYLENTGALIEQGVLSGADELLQQLEQSEKPDFVRLCCVRAGPDAAQIQNWISSRWSLQLHQARVAQGIGGVTNHYVDQTRLGVDRWLAMLAAFKLGGGASVIVDGGTALTIDVLDGNGQHVGGYILPGLNLLRDSLADNTAISLDPNNTNENTELGNSTDTAVRHGSLAMLVAIIESVARKAASTEAAVSTYFTGGDAPLLAANCGLANVQQIPSLVFDGLAIACPYSVSAVD
jgi:type III pantothenate kinase